MVKREEESNERGGAGAAQDWVPADLREQNVLSGSEAPGDEHPEPSEAGEENHVPDVDREKAEQQPAAEGDVAGEDDFALGPADEPPSAKEAIHRRIEEEMLSRVDEAAKNALEQTAGIVAGDARSRFEAEIERIEQEARSRMEVLTEKYESALSAALESASAPLPDSAAADTELEDRLAGIEEGLQALDIALRSRPAPPAVPAGGEPADAAWEGRLGSLEMQVEGIEHGITGEEQRIAERFAAIEQAAARANESSPAGLGELGERFEVLERRVDAEAESNRRVADALADNAGTRSGELKQRLSAIERRVGEIALELDGSSERADEIRRAMNTSLERFVASTQARLDELGERLRDSNQQISERLAEQATASLQKASEVNDSLAQVAEKVRLSRSQVSERFARLDKELRVGSETSKAGLKALEQKVGQAGSGRAEWLAPLERGLDKLGQELQETRATFEEREEVRRESLQLSINEIAIRLNEKLERTHASLAERLERLGAERAEAVAPPPVKEPSTRPVPARPKQARRNLQVPDGGTVPIPSLEASNLNEVTFEQLRAMGLSVTQTSRLLDLRRLLGRFSSIDELDSVPGFPDTLREEMKVRLQVSD